MPIFTGSVAHPRALVGTIQSSSWSRMVNLRQLLACDSVQYFTFPATDVWSETTHILVRKVTLTRMPRKMRLSQRLARYLWARFKHLHEVVWQIWDHFRQAICSNTFHSRPQIARMHSTVVKVDLRGSSPPCTVQGVFLPNKISGVGTIFGLLVHVIPGPNKQREFEPSIHLSWMWRQNN
jgi:hypothetical protein